MRLRFEVWGYVLTLEPRETREQRPLLDQLAEDIKRIRDHGQHGKHPEAKNMADWVLSHISYLLLVNGHETHEDAPQGAGIGGGIPYTKLRRDPYIAVSRGAATIVPDEAEPYLECSVCHTRSPHLDSAGERCLNAVSDQFGADVVYVRQCGGVMVQRPYDPIYGYKWPGEVKLSSD